MNYFFHLQDSAKAYSVLIKYLNLVLFDHNGHGHVTVSRQLLSPLLADSLVELYAEHRPEQLTNFLLHSWVKNYSPGRAVVSHDTVHCAGVLKLFIFSRLNPAIEKALALLNRSSQNPRHLWVVLELLQWITSWLTSSMSKIQTHSTIDGLSLVRNCFDPCLSEF